MHVYVVAEYNYSENEVQGVFVSLQAAMKSISDDYDKSTVEETDEFKDGAVVWASCGRWKGTEVSRFELIVGSDDA